MTISVLTTMALLSGLVWNLMLELGLVRAQGAYPSNDAWWGVAWIILTGPVGATMVDSGRPNPLAVDGLAGVSRWFVEGPGFIIVPSLVIATLVSQFLRWRRSRGVVRMQYRWFIAGVLLALLAIGLSGLLAPSGDENVINGFGLVNVLWVVPMNAVAVAIGIAVSRNHVYELNRVMSRSVSYSVVTVSLVAVYVAVVASATAVLSSSSNIAVALGTLTVAALFRPILLRVRVSVDRRRNRERYDGQLAVERFAGRPRHEVHPAVVSNELMATLEETARRSAVVLWTREPIS
ncbi:MAG: hypothetical protein LH645_13770 [Actinomycetia bacterium]|nr:hypothetical protein [Actinomycetes bacterium]